MHDPPSHFTVENSLAKELNKLSLKDRLAIQEEMHGVRCGAIDESSDLLEESLRDFDNKINSLKEQAVANPNEDGQNVRTLLRNIVRTNWLPTAAADTTSTEMLPEGNTSVEIHPEGIKSCEDTSERPERNCCYPNNCYLNDVNVRLRFIRCECFNVDKAVQRMSDFLEYCTEIFGSYICERMMRLSDFNTREEKLALKTSRSQYLPFRDRSGRRVLASVGSCNFHISLMIRLKIRMFQHWIASEDVETQRKGIVIVMWPFDENEGSESNWEKAIRPCLSKSTGDYQKLNNRAMPVRVASQQMFYKDSPIFHTHSALYVFYALTSDRRAIYNAHFGEHTELLYKLGSFGIPTDLLPISYTGVVKFTNQTAWLDFLRARERNVEEGDCDDIEERIDCPGSSDVVFRKGTTCRHNLGNTFYRGLIEDSSVEHVRAGNKKKYEITLRIVTEIEKRKGRFLEYSNENKIWMIMKDRERVRKKIAAAMKQYLRTRRDEEPSSSLPVNDEQEGLENAVNNANVILDTKSIKRGIKNAVERNSSTETSLKQYYSLGHIEKRQKIAIFNCKNEGSCFGKVFHPTL